MAESTTLTCVDGRGCIFENAALVEMMFAGELEVVDNV